METPGALEVTRIASVSVPVCVVVSAIPCVSETPCVEATPCVSGVVASVPECTLPSTPCVKGAPQAEEATGATTEYHRFDAFTMPKDIPSENKLQIDTKARITPHGEVVMRRLE